MRAIQLRFQFWNLFNTWCLKFFWGWCLEFVWNLVPGIYLCFEVFGIYLGFVARNLFVIWYLEFTWDLVLGIYLSFSTWNLLGI